MNTCFFKYFLPIFAVLAFVFPGSVSAATSTAYTRTVAGKILLPVERTGELWYVSPTTLRRYRAADASEMLSIFSKLGVIVTQTTATRIPKIGTKIAATSFSKSFGGKILRLQNEDGKFWYVSKDGLRHFFDGTKQSFDYFHTLALGISDKNLARIPEFVAAPSKASCADLTCFAKAVSEKQPMSATITQTANMMELQITSTSTMSFKVSGSTYTYSNLILAEKAAYSATGRSNLSKNGMTEKAINDMEAKVQGSLQTTIGLQQVCSFTDLEHFNQVLNRWKIGDISTDDMSFASCATAKP